MGTRFGSYAAYWIRACILRFLMTNSRLIHVGNTRAGRKLFFRLEKERQKLIAEGIDPRPSCWQPGWKWMNLTAEVSAHLASREVSLEPRPDEDGVPLAEKISGQQASPSSKPRATNFRKPCADSCMTSKASWTTSANGPCGASTWP